MRQKADETQASLVALWASDLAAGLASVESRSAVAG